MERVEVMPANGRYPLVISFRRLFGSLGMSQVWLPSP